jgi:Domain of unknown function (DUF4157)
MSRLAAPKTMAASPSPEAPVRSLLQRKCACGTHTPGGGSCQSCAGEKSALSRKSEPEKRLPAVAPPIVHEVLRGSGRPLDKSMRALMEPRFGRDFSAVRVHSGTTAAQSARAVGAVAYTVGQDIVLGPGRRDFSGNAGRALLAHELHHTVQQRGAAAILSTPIAIEPADSAHEQEAESASASVMNGSRPITPSPQRLALARLTPEKFKEDLGSTPDQKKAIAALFSDPKFISLWNYLRDCLAQPKSDLGPLSLEVTPGLAHSGAERFGSYRPSSRRLEINPTKSEHLSNPQELVDTITHEVIHAVSDLEGECVKAGAAASPLAGAATDRGPPLALVKGTADEDKFLKELGPGASNPCEEFMDLNSLAQQIIVSVIQGNIAATKVGKPTLTFVNDALRKNPAALAEYKICRDAACADPDGAKRTAKIAACSNDIITKFVTLPAQAPAPAAPTAAPRNGSAPPARAPAPGANPPAAPKKEPVPPAQAPAPHAASSADPRNEPEDKTVTTQPEPQKIEVEVAAGAEIETKRDAGKRETEASGNFSVAVVIPITERLTIGPVSFLKEAGTEIGLGGKSGPVFKLGAEATLKMISLEFEKIKTPLGLADLGINGSAIAGAEYQTRDPSSAYKAGVSTEAEMKLQPAKNKSFFITVKAGAEKSYGKESGAEWRWNSVTFSAGFSVGFALH